MFTYFSVHDRNIDNEKRKNTHQLQSATELISFLPYLLHLQSEVILTF
jgi:hypothetical protein